MDHLLSDLGRAFGRLKQAWLALGLGLKPILGPAGFKLLWPFKSSKPVKSRCRRPLKVVLDPSKGTAAGRGGLRLSARRRKPAPATGSVLDSTLMPAATGSEIAQFSDVGIGSSTLEASAPTVRDVGIGSSTLEASAPTVRDVCFKYEGSVSRADSSVRNFSPSAPTVSLPVSLPVHFYNRKHKVKRASNLDLGKFAGDLFSIAPGAVPLVGEQSSVSGGSSGLFSAFESSGFSGSKEVSCLLAPAVEANKSLAHSSPAKGMLRRGFLMPRPCGGARRSPEPVSLSEVGESSERSNLLGEAFTLPWNISEAGVEVEDGVSGANGYPEAVADALAIAPFLGVSCGGDEQGFLDLMCDIEEGHKREGMFADDGGSVVKSKGWRERKNLECSLNFDVGSIGSSRVKNRSLRV
jgi:hypothetical protein